MRWLICGPNVPDIHVYADSFDQAIAKARRISPNYCGGYVDED